MQPGLAEHIHQLLHARLMGHRRMGVGATGWRFGGIFSPQPVDVVHRLGLGVVRLEVAVAHRPSRREAIDMDHLLKIPLPKAEVGSAIHL
jgi:hypothetical protein